MKKKTVMVYVEVAGYLLRRAVRLPDMYDKSTGSITVSQLMQVIVTHSLEVAAKIRVFFVVVEKVAIYRKIKDIKVL